MKDTLLEIINNDSSYNKSATRYLYKTHPELWKQILNVTDFLPEEALAKQRVWHIINDCYERPKCPITGKLVKWNENRYLKTIDKSSKQKRLFAMGVYDNSHSDEQNEKRRQGNLRAVKNGRKYRDKSTYTDTAKENAKKTFLRNYGVDNPSKHVDVRNKISKYRIDNGATPKHLRSLRSLYVEAVRYYTKKNWLEHFNIINPKRLNRSKNSLDHIYSVQMGFVNNIPPYIIGHYTNLRILPLSENSSKGLKCHKTLDELYADYFQSFN